MTNQARLRNYSEKACKKIYSSKQNRNIEINIR